MTTNLKVVTGNLLAAEEPVIVQQLNCLCVKPHGLSDHISRKFTYADVYRRRRQQGRRNLAIPEDQGVPGQIEISEPPQLPATKEQPVVVGLYGQYDYGIPGRSARRSSLATDNFQLREQWFMESLGYLRQFLIDGGYPSVAFPYMIGCGLAGGNWVKYQAHLEQFAKDAPFQVVIYQLA